MFLIILDGWGHGPDPKVSAIAQARTRFMDSLYDLFPDAELVTHGSMVGLPEGQMGNSEVGHLNIGAGRIVYQEFARINNAIAEGSFFREPALVDALTKAQEAGQRIHLMGLVSQGGVHSHMDHLKALCDLTESYGLEEVFIHVFTDGRDVDPKSAIRDVADLQLHIRDQRVEIASLIGRYYAMDRDKRWERIKLAYDLIVNGEGIPVTDLLAAIDNSYAENITDEFIEPIVVTDDHGNAKGTLSDGDLIIFFNFRTDRPRQLTEVLTQKDYPDFDMRSLEVDMLSMTEYDPSFKNVQAVFRNDRLKNTLGEVISNAGKTQLRIAETEKYPHVTYFFSGGREEAFSGETRILIPSPKVATYDLQPSMSAPEVRDAVIKHLKEETPDFICLNFANTDMVGHTGVLEAAMEAAETVDNCLQQIIPVALKKEYGIILIADHGNSDTMRNPDGSPHTAHTMNPVPIIYLSGKNRDIQIKDGKLADIAPTILHLMEMECPSEMDGDVLVQPT